MRSNEYCAKPVYHTSHDISVFFFAGCKKHASITLPVKSKSREDIKSVGKLPASRARTPSATEVKRGGLFEIRKPSTRHVSGDSNPAGISQPKRAVSPESDGREDCQLHDSNPLFAQIEELVRSSDNNGHIKAKAGPVKPVEGSAASPPVSGASVSIDPLSGKSSRLQDSIETDPMIEAHGLTLLSASLPEADESGQKDREKEGYDSSQALNGEPAGSPADLGSPKSLEKTEEGDKAPNVAAVECILPKEDRSCALEAPQAADVSGEHPTQDEAMTSLSPRGSNSSLQESISRLEGAREADELYKAAEASCTLSDEPPFVAGTLAKDANNARPAESVEAQKRPMSLLLSNLGDGHEDSQEVEERDNSQLSIAVDCSLPTKEQSSAEGPFEVAGDRGAHQKTEHEPPQPLSSSEPVAGMSEESMKHEEPVTATVAGSISEARGHSDTAAESAAVAATVGEQNKVEKATHSVSEARSGTENTLEAEVGESLAPVSEAIQEQKPSPHRRQTRSSAYFVAPVIPKTKPSVRPAQLGHTRASADVHLEEQGGTQSYIEHSEEESSTLKSNLSAALRSAYSILGGAAPSRRQRQVQHEGEASEPHAAVGWLGRFSASGSHSYHPELLEETERFGEQDDSEIPIHTSHLLLPELPKRPPNPHPRGSEETTPAAVHQSSFEATERRALESEALRWGRRLSTTATNPREPRPARSGPNVNPYRRSRQVEGFAKAPLQQIHKKL